jgi:hypothetical protein
MTKQIVAFRSFAKARKYCGEISSCLVIQGCIEHHVMCRAHNVLLNFTSNT